MEKYYLWTYGEHSEQDIYVYLNEKNEKIYGYAVNRDNLTPFDKDSKNYIPNNKCKRLVVKTEKIGLTDINYNEYQIMKENLFDKK
jgi:predicted RNA-binding protein (virulence factor B family)